MGKSESEDHVVHKSEDSNGQKNSCPSFWFVLWNSVLPPYWQMALGRRDRDRTCRLGAVPQSGPQKTWRNLLCLGTAPHVALLCFGRYNTALQEIFRPRKQIIGTFAWLCSGCGHVFFYMRNNVTCSVYYRHALNRASASRWSSIVLPYLGPEIITVIKAASSFAPSDSRSGSRPNFRKGDDRILPSMVISSTLRYSNSTTASVLDVWIRWHP